GARSLRILDHPGVLAVHDGDAGIRRSEVDTDYFCHFMLRVAGLPWTLTAFQSEAPRGIGRAARPRGGVAGYIRRAAFLCKADRGRRRRPFSRSPASSPCPDQPRSTPPVWRTTCSTILAD